MMVLAIDTCGPICSVALGATTAQAEKVCEAIGRGHAERLIPLMQEIASRFGDCSTVLSAVERVAVTVGPGSFTGVRVGVAVARAVALGTTADINAFTHHALLQAQDGGRCDGIVTSARRGELYASLSVGSSLTEPKLTRAEEFAQSLPPGARLIGDCAAEVAALRGDLTGKNGPDADASFLIDMVVRDGTPRQTDRRPPEPLYLRPPDAKPQDGFALKRAGGS